MSPYKTRLKLYKAQRGVTLSISITNQPTAAYEIINIIPVVQTVKILIQSKIVQPMLNYS